MRAESLDAGIPNYTLDLPVPQNPESTEVYFLYNRIAADVMDAGVPNDKLNLPPPQHPVLLKDYGLFVPAVKHHNPLNEANVVGNDNEVKAGTLISRVDFVEEVIQMEPWSTEDKQMIDLIVRMREGFPIPFVNVQVKSSKGTVYQTFDRVGELLDIEDRARGVARDKSNGNLEHERREDWLKRHRLIVINAGYKGRDKMTDQYIVEKFDRELERIIAYEASVKAYQIAA